ncbi:MAG: GNAT family N-acetyltransferase [Candidatus Bathyarchaeia archaeon]
MARVRRAGAGDIRGLMDCQVQVLESLRGVLPTPFIEHEMGGLRGRGREDALEKAIGEEDTIVLVAEEGGTIVGFAQGKVDRGGTSWLAYMGVAPAFRRRGIARELVRRFIAESRARGAHTVSLYTAPELRPAIRLYTEMGFTPAGRMRRSRYGVALIEYSKPLD